MMRELFNRLEPDGHNVLFNQCCQLAVVLSGAVCFGTAFVAWEVHQYGELRQGAPPPSLFLAAAVAIWFALVVLVGAKMRSHPTAKIQSAAMHIFITGTLWLLFMCALACIA